MFLSTVLGAEDLADKVPSLMKFTFRWERHTIINLLTKMKTASGREVLRKGLKRRRK